MTTLWYGEKTNNYLYSFLQQVPGAEGRAGMAAIVEPSEGIDLTHFVQAVKKQLPSYATPLFIRLVEQMDITGTKKNKIFVANYFKY